MNDPDSIDIRDIVPRKGIVAMVAATSVFATRKPGGELAFFIESHPEPGAEIKVFCQTGDGGEDQIDPVETTIRVGRRFEFRFVPYLEIAQKDTLEEITRVRAEYEGLRPTPITNANIQYTSETMFLDDFEDELEPAEESVVESQFAGGDVALPRNQPLGSSVVFAAVTGFLVGGVGKAVSSIQSAASGRGLPTGKRGIAGALVGSIVGSGLILLAIPSAEVTVNVHPHAASLHSQLVISPSTPGFKVRTITEHDSYSQQFQTSGTKLTPGAKATVKISFTNNCGTNVGSIQLVPGQTVETAQGVEYTQDITSGTVIVNPDGVPVDVPYTAANPGNNVGAKTLTTIKGLQSSEQGCFTATNPLASQGGVAPVFKPALADTDLVRAQGEVKTALASQEAAALANAKHPGETLIVEPFSKLDSFTTDHPPGAFTGGFLAEGSSTEVGVYYLDSEVSQSMIDQFLAKEVPATWRVTGGAPKVEDKLTGEDASGKLTFDFTVAAPIAFNRDAAWISDQLRWRDDKSVRDYLKSLGVDSVVIHRSWYQIPWHVNVVVNEPKALK